CVPTRALVAPPAGSPRPAETILPAVTRGMETSPPAPTRVTEGAPSERVELRATRPQPRARIEPLFADRFLVKFTASRELRDKLEFARDLTRHRDPAGDL